MDGDTTSAPALLPIVSAAVATTYFERDSIFQCRSAIELGDALTRHASAVLFKAADRTVTVRNYILEDVVLDANSLLLLKDRQAIAETAYFIPPNDSGQRPAQTVTSPLGENEVLVVGTNNVHWAYQHWLTQCLPAIDWSLRQSRTHDVRLLLRSLQPWQEDFLALLGYAGVPRLTPDADALYHLRRVEFCEFINGSTSFDVSLALMETIQRILDALPARPSHEKVLYVRYAQPYYGGIRNEAAVLELLEQHGVTIVEPERLGTAERINLFRHADAMIGPTGQYLADVVFCRPGALLWEWMPRHHQNHTFNRLAQAAQVDYLGDLFENTADPESAGAWEVDLSIISRRLARVIGRCTAAVSGVARPDGDGDSLPPHELMLRFESLGRSCEFGLVQRAAGVEPLGLLRLNAMFGSQAFGLERLVAALDRRFEGLGEAGTVTVVTAGLPNQRELVVSESVYGLHYRIGIADGDVDVEVQTEREMRRLRFLRRLLLEDLESGEKTFVWTSEETTDKAQLRPLLNALWRLGPNALLWVVSADQDHPAGSVVIMERDFLTGYVERSAPGSQAARVHPRSWFDVCARTEELLRPMRTATRAPTDAVIAGDRPPARSLALADIAESTAFIERERIFHGRSIISLGAALASRESSFAFKGLAITATLRNHTLRNVVLDANTLRLLKDGEIIPETEYFAPAFDPSPDQSVSTPLSDNEVLIFGCNNQHWGYHHWLTQCLPAIDWSLRQTRSLTVRLLLPELQPWQEDFLRLLGHADVPRLQPRAGARYDLPWVEFSDFITGHSSFTVSLSLLDTIRRIKEAAPSHPSTGKVLYIRNATPYYGGIGNEAAVMALLRLRGVTIIEADRLDTIECINLFRHADAVIGPVGQYLAGVLFCRPGALLWEWMPGHHQNHTFNCLAQTAQVDYWGDLFESAADPQHPGQWDVDLDVVEQRLEALSTRLALLAAEPEAVPAPPVAGNASASLEKLMLRFESLGDNCEFGLVQRKASAEPLGLLRFNGMRLREKERLAKLVLGLERRFEGLGEFGTCIVVPTEIELFVSDTIYDFWFHTGARAADVDLEAEAQRQRARLKFLRRKLFEDLESGDKILVWKSLGTTTREQLQPLLDILRRLGPNTLLWVNEADADHPAGTVEELEPDLLKGYISRMGIDRHLIDIEYESWFELCWRVDELRRPGAPALEERQEAPAPPMSAMDWLARGKPASAEVLPSAKPESTAGSGLWGWFRRR